MFAKHFHVQVTVGFDPVFVDFDRQRPNEPQSAFLVRKDSDDMGSTLELLIKPLEHIGAFEMFMMLSRQSVKGKSLLDVLFDPCAESRVFFLPAKQLGRRVSAGCLGVASIVSHRNSTRQSSAILRGR